MIPAQWQVAGASVCGVSHLKTGQPCQDAHLHEAIPGGELLLAVADGAGSAALAEIGSSTAVRVAIGTLRESLEAEQTSSAGAIDASRWSALLGEAFACARDAVVAEADSRQLPLRDFATTLLLAVAGDRGIAAAQVGDGAIVAADGAGVFHSLTVPSRGEYVNETTFLTSEGALEKIQIKIWDGEAVSLAALSDGLQMLALKMATGEPHAPFFEPLFRFLRQEPEEAAVASALESFLRSPRIAERADDDLTLVLAVRAS